MADKNYFNKMQVRNGETVYVRDTEAQSDISALKINKQDALSFDSIPTLNSNKPVTSNGIYQALQNNFNYIAGNHITITNNNTINVALDNTINASSEHPVAGSVINTALSNIQTQLNNKQPAGTYITNINNLTGSSISITGSNIAVSSNDNTTIATAINNLNTAVNELNNNNNNNNNNLATVATTGDYNDLINKPVLFDGDYTNLNNKPEVVEDLIENNIAYSDFILQTDLQTFEERLPKTYDINFLSSVNNNFLNLGLTNFYIENISTTQFDENITILNYFLSLINNYYSKNNFQVLISSINTFLITNIETKSTTTNSDNFLYFITLLGSINNNYIDLSGTAQEKLDNLTLNQQHALIIIDSETDILYFKYI